MSFLGSIIIDATLGFQIINTILLLAIPTLVIVLIVGASRRSKRRNDELNKINVKIESLSKKNEEMDQ